MQSEAPTSPCFTFLDFIKNLFKHLTEKQMLSLIGVLPAERGNEDLKLSMEKGD